MKSAFRLVALLVLLAASAGCTVTGGSSGFSGIGRLPAGIPNPVIVRFEGSPPADLEAAQNFTAGLEKLGFKVVRRDEIVKVFRAWEGQLPDLTAEPNRSVLRERLGVVGIFVGSISQDSRYGMLDTDLDVKLFSIPLNKVIWDGKADNHQVVVASFATRAKGAEAATGKVLELLRKNLYGY